MSGKRVFFPGLSLICKFLPESTNTHNRMKKKILKQGSILLKAGGVGQGVSPLQAKKTSANLSQLLSKQEKAH